MEKPELIKKLYDGERVSNTDVYNELKYLLTPSNIRLLAKKLICYANLVEYDYLKDPKSAVLLVDMGRLSAVLDMLNWSITIGTDIPLIAWKREMADFITETPETPLLINKNTDNEKK